jgi:hypothetical protein
MVGLPVDGVGGRVRGGGGDGGNDIPSLGNLSYGPARVAVTRGETAFIQGRADFRDNGGDIVELRLQINGGPIQVLQTPSLSGITAGTASLSVEVSVEEAGTFRFEIWVVDSGGRESNRLAGTVEAFIDDTGASWRKTGSFAGSMLSAVVWGGAQYVAVGTVGAVRTSPDAIHWTSQSSNVQHWLRSVAWSGSQFAAVGQHAMTYEWVVMTSPDGQTWTVRQTSLPNNFGGLYKVVWTGSQFVAVGEETIYPGGSTFALVLTSPDGITWTQHSQGAIPGIMRSVASSGPLLVAVGATGSSDPPVAWTSQDGGLSWAASPMPGSTTASDLTFGQGRFVAVSGVTGSPAYLSTDGISWQPSTDTLAMGATSIVTSASRYLAVTAPSSVYVSDDALHWVSGSLPGFCGNGVIWDGKGYVGVGLDVCRSP